MAQVGRTFRIFANSAFSDLRAERNALRDGWSGTVIDCSAEGCRDRLRTSPFTVAPPKWS